MWGLAERALRWFVSHCLNVPGSQACPLSPDSLVKPEHHYKGTCSPGQALSALRAGHHYLRLRDHGWGL